MNILIIGAGAIGGFIGGKLAARHNVTLFDRAALVDAVRERGLRIVEPETETKVTNLAASTSLDDIFGQTPRFDLAIVCRRMASAMKTCSARRSADRTSSPVRC